MTTRQWRTIRGLCALAVLTAGCAMDEERLETADFGNAVRHTIALQTDGAGYHGTGMDAQKAAAVMKAYREDVGSLQAAQEAVPIEVGN
jgi:hypothetical protein